MINIVFDPVLGRDRYDWVRTLALMQDLESESISANTPKTIEHNLGRIVVPYAYIDGSGNQASLYVYDVGLNSFKCESTVNGTVYYR